MINLPSSVIIACKIATSLDIITTSPTVENGLTEFVTEEVKVSSFVPRIPVSHDESPFRNQTPSQILGRERLVLQKTFSSSETTLMTVVDPRLWASVNANEGCLRTFRYARWKSIKYRVVVQSNPFVFGYFTLTCLPNDNRRHNNSLALSDLGWFSHDDCLIVDIGSMPESTISVPWLFNNTWVDLEKWADGGNVSRTIQLLSGLKILYDNTLNVTSSAVPKTFSISVFMKFEGVEVSCPISPGAAVRTHQAQMMGFGMLGGMAADIAWKAAEKKIAGGVEGLVNQGFEKATEYTESLFAAEEGVAPEFGATSEAPAAPAVCASSVEEGEGGQPQEIVPSVFGGMNYSCSRNVLGTGTMVLPKGRQNSLSEFLQKPTCVIRTSLISQTGFVTAVPLWQQSVLSTITNTGQCSRLRFLAQFFRYWRGSVTYTFFFISSPMVTFRFKIGLDYQGGSLEAVDPGDTLQTIVTVCGPTLHQVTIPYLYTTPWQFIGSSLTSPARDVTPAVTVSEFSPASKSGDIVPSCYLLVYESANSDFVMTSQTEPMPYAASEAVPERRNVHQAQMDIRKFRSWDATQFGKVDPVKFSSDGVGTFEAIAKRWSPVVLKTLDRPVYYSDNTYQADPGVSTQSTAAALCSIFYWNRGQYKLKIGFKVDSSTDQSAVGILKMSTFHIVANEPNAGVPAEVRFTDGATAISFGLSQVIEATIPFLCNVEWVPCSTEEGFFPVVGSDYSIEFPNLWAQGATLPLLNFVAVAAGRDYCYSYNLPPPYFGARWYDTVPYSLPAAKSINDTPQSFSSHMRLGSPVQKRPTR